MTLTDLSHEIADDLEYKAEQERNKRSETQRHIIMLMYKRARTSGGD